MDQIVFFSVSLQVLLDVRACTVIYKTATLPGCEMEFTPTIPPLSSSNVTYGNECLLLCRNNNKCNGISICRHPEDQELFTCNLFGTATDGTCTNLTSDAGCRYMEFEIVPNGLQCVPPRIFDEDKGECRCDPVWMIGPNCDRYYIDCSHASSNRLTVPGDFLTMSIKPRISSAPIQVKCFLKYGGYTYIQERSLSCPDNLSGLGWNDFKDGFGEFTCSFFLGLEKIYQILQNGVFFLNAKFYTSTGGNSYYSGFTIGNESTNYTINYESFSSPSNHRYGNGLNYGGSNFAAKGSRFATHDNDFNGCAQAQGTGWWYSENCSYVNLNMPLGTPPPSGSLGYASWPRSGNTALETVVGFHLAMKRTG